LNNTDIDADRRPSTATCPRCRPGRVWSYSWRILEGRHWASVLWCDAQPACMPHIVCADHAQPTREAAEANAFRKWCDFNGTAEQHVGGAA
jgi:hypothetical protein